MVKRLLGALRTGPLLSQHVVRSLSLSLCVGMCTHSFRCLHAISPLPAHLVSAVCTFIYHCLRNLFSVACSFSVRCFTLLFPLSAHSFFSCLHISCPLLARYLSVACTDCRRLKNLSHPPRETCQQMESPPPFGAHLTTINHHCLLLSRCLQVLPLH